MNPWDDREGHPQPKNGGERPPIWPRFASFESPGHVVFTHAQLSRPPLAARSNPRLVKEHSENAPATTHAQRPRSSRFFKPLFVDSIPNAARNVPCTRRSPLLRDVPRTDVPCR